LWSPVPQGLAAAAAAAAAVSMAGWAHRACDHPTTLVVMQR